MRRRCGPLCRLVSCGGPSRELVACRLCNVVDGKSGGLGLTPGRDRVKKRVAVLPGQSSLVPTRQYLSRPRVRSTH